MKATFQANCRTTAMAIMPHTDIERALELALSLDIPFWPQLPKVSFYEDMYFHAASNFPGMIIVPSEQSIRFDTKLFQGALPEYAQRLAGSDLFALDPEQSPTFYRFLEKDLARYPAIRGQVSGPVNLGYRISDETMRPIIYNDEVRPLLFDFIQRKANYQLQKLREKNPNAFVWLDEPGLIWAFSGFSGYNDMQVKQDYAAFISGIEGVKALHLCSNINLPYLLELGADFVSFDAYQLEVMPRAYAGQVSRFLNRGGILSWGIVPTEPPLLQGETPQNLARRLMGYWKVIAENSGLPESQIARQAILTPAKCCVKSFEQYTPPPGSSHENIEQESVEKAFAYLKEVSAILRDAYSLN